MLQARIEQGSTASDEALVAQARTGSQTAFVELLRRHQDRIYRLAIRMCHNAADAEEVCQEAFRLAFSGIESFNGDSQFATWLYRIATNEALMRLRSERRSPLRSLESSVSPAGRREASEHAGEHAEAADELVHRKMLTERVLAALARLDDTHRAALVLRDLEELSADEAAEILGISAETVRQRAHRARLKLREQLLLADGRVAAF